MKKPKGLRAWLITWDWSGDHAEPSKKIVEILSPRLSAKRVREIVELRYHQDASLSEKMAWRLRNQAQPDPAEFARIEGVKWEGQITCGDNPWLLARLVDDLFVSIDADGIETATWTERHSLKEMTEKMRTMRNLS